MSTVPYAFVKVGAAFALLPTGETEQLYREIPTTSCGISGNVAHKFRFLPVGNVLYTIDTFGALELNGTPVLDIGGDAIDCSKIKALVVTLTPYDPLEPATGSAEITTNDLFTAGGYLHPMNVGDLMALTNAIGVTTGSGTSIAIESSVGSANLAIDVILIGAAAGVSS
jgi:hypothetical protein